MHSEHITPRNQPLTTHPAWCSPLECVQLNNDLLHRSTLITHNLPTSVWHYRLVRCDEFAFDRPGGIELIVTIECDDQPAFDAVIPLRDVQAIADALLTERARAQFLSAPVVHNTRTAA